MNYIQEINAFERWLETNYLPGTSQLLWYKLVALFNRCGWAEWVTVDNQRLMVFIQCKSEKTFIRARDNLIESGLFVYQKGKKGSPNRYKMISFEKINTVNNTVNTTVYPTVYPTVQTTVKKTVYPTVETTVINKQNINVNKTLKKYKRKLPEEKPSDTHQDISSDEKPKEKHDRLIVSKVVDYLNQVCGTEFKPSISTTRNLIKARVNEGFVFDDFKSVIDHKNAEWRNDAKMHIYLRPQTLFGTKFEGYVIQSKKQITNQSQTQNDGYNYGGKGERSL